MESWMGTSWEAGVCGTEMESVPIADGRISIRRVRRPHGLSSWMVAPNWRRTTMDGDGQTPVAATLHDFDVVYAVRIASYGAILATLACQPGAIVHVAMLYLAKGRLQRMYESEDARSACSNRNRNTEKLPIDSEAQRRLAEIFVVRAVWAGDPPFREHAKNPSWRAPTRRLAQLSFRPLAIPDHMVAVVPSVRPPLAGNAA